MNKTKASNYMRGIYDKISHLFVTVDTNGIYIYAGWKDSNNWNSTILSQLNDSSSGSNILAE